MLAPYQHKVQTCAMEQHNNNQQDGADTHSRQRFQFIWDLGQQPWNARQTVTPLVLVNVLQLYAPECELFPD